VRAARVWRICASGVALASYIRPLVMHRYWFFFFLAQNIPFDVSVLSHASISGTLPEFGACCNRFAFDPGPHCITAHTSAQVSMLDSLRVLRHWAQSRAMTTTSQRTTRLLLNQMMSSSLTPRARCRSHQQAKMPNPSPAVAQRMLRALRITCSSGLHGLPEKRVALAAARIFLHGLSVCCSTRTRPKSRPRP
jgi:hypothetical protein